MRGHCYPSSLLSSQAGTCSRRVLASPLFQGTEYPLPCTLEPLSHCNTRTQGCGALQSSQALRPLSIVRLPFAYPFAILVTHGSIVARGSTLPLDPSSSPVPEPLPAYQHHCLDSVFCKTDSRACLSSWPPNHSHCKCSSCSTLGQLNVYSSETGPARCRGGRSLPPASRAPDCTAAARPWARRSSQIEVEAAKCVSRVASG